MPQKNFKSNPSRTAADRIEGAGIKRYLPGEPVLLSLRHIQSQKTDPSAYKRKELTNLQKILLNGPKHPLTSTEISGFVTASTYHKTPQQAVETFDSILNGNKQLVAWDTEILGLNKFDPNVHGGLDLFMPTEISLRAYSPKQGRGNLLSKTSPFQHHSSISALVKPTEELQKNYRALIEKVRQGRSLTQSERRTFVDLMRYSQIEDPASFSGVFGINLKNVHLFNTGASFIKRKNGIFVKHHGMFSGKGIHDSLLKQKAGIKTLQSLIPHAESGLESLIGFGMSTDEVQNLVDGFIAQHQNSVFVGMNQLNFDIPVMQQYYKKLGKKFNMPANQLDFYHLASSLYTNPEDLHTELLGKQVSRIGRRTEINFTLESILETLGVKEQPHSAYEDAGLLVDEALNKTYKTLKRRMDKDVAFNPLSLDQPHIARNTPIKKGDTLFAFRSFYSKDDELSFAVERDIFDENKLVQVYGDYKANSRAFYKVQDIWKQTVDQDEMKDIFGVTLLDEEIGRELRIAAESPELLAAKIQSFAVTQDVYGKESRQVLVEAVANDRARRLYERMFEFRTSPKQQSRGISLARNLYSIASELEDGYTQLDLINAFKSRNINSQATLRDFQTLFPRLKSEAEVMLSAIGKIDEAVEAQGNRINADAAWLAFYNRLPGHVESIERLNWNNKGVYVRNALYDGTTLINLQNIDTAKASLFGVIDNNIGNKFISKAYQDSAREQYLSREIVDDLIEREILSYSDAKRILEQDGVGNKISKLISVLYEKPEADMLPAVEVESMRARANFNLSDIGESFIYQAIEESIDEVRNVMAMPRAEADISIQLLEKMREMDIYQKDEQRQAIAEFASKIYHDLTGKGVQVDFVKRVLPGDQTALQAVMYSNKNHASVVRALLEGKHTGVAATWQLPTFDESGNIVFGKQAKLRQHFLRYSKEGPLERVGILDMLYDQFSYSYGIEGIAREIREGNIEEAHRLISRRTNDAIKRLGGSTKYIRRSERDYADVSKYGRTLSDVNKERHLIIAELAKQEYGREWGELGIIQKEDFLRRKLPEILQESGMDIGYINAHSIKSDHIMAGKIAVHDIRKWSAFGTYGATTRDNIVQFLNYVPVSEEASVAIAKSGARGLVPGSFSRTASGIAAEMQTTKNHTTGISAIGVVANDQDLETLRKMAIEKARRDGADDVVRELESLALTRPRTYENSIVFRQSFIDNFEVTQSKNYQFAVVDATEEFIAIADRFKAGEAISIDDPKFTYARFLQGEDDEVLRRFDLLKKGGKIDVVDIQQENGIFNVTVASKRKASIADKFAVESEKGTGGSIISDMAANYMFGEDVQYAYWTNMIKHRDFNAYLKGMWNYAALESLAENREEEFARATRKYFGFTPEKKVAWHGGVYYEVPDVIYNKGENAIADMMNLYKEMGYSEGIWLGEGDMRVYLRREMNEVRLMNVNTELKSANVRGHGQGIKFGMREWQALERRGLAYKDPVLRTMYDRGGASNLTEIGRWLQDGLDSDPQRKEYLAQARGFVKTLDSVFGEVDDLAESQFMTISDLKALSRRTGLFTDVDIAGTVFDQRRFFKKATGDIVQDGFYLDLGTDITIDMGKGKFKTIDRLWIGPQKLGMTEDNLYVMSMDKRKLADLLDTVAEFHALYDMPDALDDQVVKDSAQQLKSKMSTQIRDWLDEIAYELTDSKSSTFERVLGGRMPTSLMSRLQIASPLAYTDGTLSYDDLATIFVSRDRMAEVFGEKTLTSRIRLDGGRTTTLEEYLLTEGIEAYGERFPLIHQKGLTSVNIKISNELEGNAAIISPSLAEFMDGDMDGDILGKAIAWLQDMNPLESSSVASRKRFWATQEELKKARIAQIFGDEELIAQGLGDLQYDTHAHIMDRLLDKETGVFAAGKYSREKAFSEALIQEGVTNLADDALNDSATLSAKITRQSIGRLSNISAKISSIAQDIYKGDFDRYGDEESYLKFLQIEEFGRVLEQNVGFSSKHFTEGSSLLAIETLVHQLSSSEDADKDILLDTLKILDIDSSKIKVRMARDLDSPAWAMEEVVDTFVEMKSMIGRHWNDLQLKVGVSGLRTAPEAYEALTSSGGIVDSKMVSFLEKIDMLQEAGYYVDRSKRPKLGVAQTFTDLLESGHTQVGGATREAISEATEQATSQLSRLGDAVGETIEDIGTEMSAQKSLKTGLAVMGGMLAIGLALRVMNPRDSDVIPDEPPPPVTTHNLGQRSAYVEEDSPQTRGLKVNIRATGTAGGHEAASYVDQAMNNGMPFTVRTHVNVTDNTQKFSPQFLQNTFAESLR